jgi:hypothetical protein
MVSICSSPPDRLKQVRGRIGAEHLRHHRTADEARRHIRNAYLDFAHFYVDARAGEPVDELDPEFW